MSTIPPCTIHFLYPLLCLICLAGAGLSLRLQALPAGEGTPELFRAGGGRRVQLWDGERISGQILDLNRDVLRLRTAWAARLELPRAAVASIDPLPGWRTIVDEDFRHKPSEPAANAAGLRFSGEPTFTDAEDGTPSRAFVLRAAGQSMTYTLRSHVTRGDEEVLAGRVGINFQERGQPQGARWTVELLFQQGERTRRVTITVAGDGEHYAVDAPPLSPPKLGGELRSSPPNLGGDKGGGTSRRVKRTPGWHRLIVQFRKHSLRLTCDDDVVWHNLDEGPGGRLQRVTVACQRLAEHEALRGSVAWTEFCIERAVDEHPQPRGEAERDAVRLLSDDHLFGRILHADRRALQIEGRFGKRSLPWTALSGCSLRRPADPPRANAGAKTRLLVRSGLCEENDVLEGVVTALDERRLVLRHALLGEVTLERRRIREMRPWSGSSK